MEVFVKVIKIHTSNLSPQTAATTSLQMCRGKKKDFEITITRKTFFSLVSLRNDPMRSFAPIGVHMIEVLKGL